MRREKPGFRLRPLAPTAEKAPPEIQCCHGVRGRRTLASSPVSRALYCLRHRKPPKVFPVTQVFPLRAGCGGDGGSSSEPPRAGFQAGSRQGLTNPAAAETIEKLHPRSMWACGAVWERASMAWKRSSVRSRPGPPIKSIAYVEDPSVSHLQNVTCLRLYAFHIPY